MLDSNFYVEFDFDPKDALYGVEEKLEYINGVLEELDNEDALHENKIQELNQFYSEAVSVLESFEEEYKEGVYVWSTGEKEPSSNMNLDVSVGDEEVKKPEDMTIEEKTILYCDDLATQYTEKLDETVRNSEISHELKLGEDIGRRRPQKVPVEEREDE